MLQYRSRHVSYLELWFDTPAPPQCAADVDVLCYWQRPQPLPGGSAQPFYTLLVDLQRAESAIFDGLRRSTRANIRRAESRDAIECRVLDETSPAVRARFCAAYADFASRRGLSGADANRLHMLAERRMLALSSASRDDLGAIVFHAYLLFRGRARLVHSVTVQRDAADSGISHLAGRANRYLHWADIVHFRAHGVHTYDFGGWYEGHDDKERLGINEFKEEFGGRVVCEHNGKLPLTWKGTAFMTLQRVVNKNTAESRHREESRYGGQP